MGGGQAAVLAEPGQDGLPSLTAWVVPAGPGGLTAEQVRSRLRAVLPPTMIPSRLVIAADLPRTSTGKIDGTALRALDHALDPDRPLVAPRTPLEQWLAGQWSELLDLDRISVQDDFFDLGGDSFTAMRLIGRAQRRGLPIEPADIYTTATLTSLASLMTSRSANGDPGQGAGAQP